MIRRLMIMLTAAALTAAMSVSAFAEGQDTMDPAIEEVETGNSGSGEVYLSAYISDTYNEEFNTYEVLICDQIAFYTNVANGGITADPVIIDFPAGVDMKLEKDGKPISFTNKQPITEYGSYSMTILIDGEELVGGYAGMTYYAIYRFRIQEKPAGSTSSDTDDDYDDGGDDTLPDIDEPDETLPEDTGTPDDPTEQQPQQSEATFADDGTDAPEEVTVVTGDTSLVTQTFTSNNVSFVTKAGTEFTSNVPQGMVTANSVKVRFSSDVKFELYKDGVLTEFTSGGKISLPGKYQIMIYDGSGELPAEYDFEIIKKYVSGMERFTVPEGCEISMVLLEGEQVRSNKRYVDFGSEGLYTIHINAGSLSITENITLDNTAPEFVLDRVTDGVAYGGTVTLQFLSNDVASYVITFDGEPHTRGVKMSEPGNYTVTVYDEAGNVSTQSFELEYRMNSTAILVIVIAGLIVVAAIVFVIYSRSKFIIR